ncbi:MAG: hypothetical protein NC336_07350 [Clostridium sp.]|nr:hypothetical protein [Clostridium sp.]
MTRQSIVWYLIVAAGINLLSGCDRCGKMEGEKYDAYLSDCDTIASFDGLNVFDPDIIFVKDSLHVLSTEYVLYIYNSESGRLSELITVGDGPCDVVDYTSVGTAGDTMIWAYDGNVGKSVLINLDGFDRYAMTLPKLRMLNELQPISDCRLIGAPYGKPSGYYLFDLDGNIVDSLSYFPPKPKNISDWTHTFACSGHIAVSPDGHYFARSVAKDGGIDFFEFKNDKIYNIARYAEFNMEYTTDDNSRYPLPVTTEKSRCGYFSLTPTNRGFMALFSPLPIRDNENFAATEIHMFSFDGLLEKKLKLEFPLSSIAFDSSTKQISGVTAISENSGSSFLVRFNI